MDKGVLILPDYKNNSTTSELEEYGYKFANGHLYDPVSKSEHGLLGTIHTHLVDMHDKGAGDPPGLDDINKFTKETPNKPFMTMGYGGKVYGARGNESGYQVIQLPKGYSTMDNILHGADLKSLLKSNEK